MKSINPTESVAEKFHQKAEFYVKEEGKRHPINTSLKGVRQKIKYCFV
ncbi:hypothetical protein [Okeania sp. KiyG1]|nr:hypothetical protein [Okeania sp. KiyG1]